MHAKLQVFANAHLLVYCKSRTVTTDCAQLPADFDRPAPGHRDRDSHRGFERDAEIGTALRQRLARNVHNYCFTLWMEPQTGEE